MKCATQLICLFAATWLGGATLSQGATAEEQSCEILDAFTTDIATAIDTAKRIMSLLDDEVFETIETVMRKLPSDFDKGAIVDVFSLDGLVADHLIVVSSPSVRNLYIRVFYQASADDMVGTQFHFTNDFEEMTVEKPIVSEPRPIAC